MDFRGRESRYDLTVSIDGANLANVPTSWGLESVGLAGRLTGTGRLLLGLDRQRARINRVDRSGNRRNGLVAGHPARPGRLKLRGEGLRADVAPADQAIFLPQWVASEFEVHAVEVKEVFAHFRSKEEEAGQAIPIAGRWTSGWRFGCR